MSAMGTEDSVLVCQMSAYARCDRFLSNVSMACAVDQAALMRTGQFLLRFADDLHRTVEKEGGGKWQMEGGSEGHGLLSGLDELE